MNFVILNAGIGNRIKSYGPKCLLKFADGQSLLERQIRIINNHYNNPKFFNCIGFENYKILKNKSIKKHNIQNTINENFENTNDLYSLKQILLNNDLDSGCFVFHGDIVFDENHFPHVTDVTTLYTSQNSVKNKLGINSNNGIAHYIMWDSPNTWSEFCYLDSNIIQSIKKYTASSTEYLFEFINSYIDNNNLVKVEPFGSEIIDIDSLSDLDVANAKFSISKV